MHSSSVSKIVKVAGTKSSTFKTRTQNYNRGQNIAGNGAGETIMCQAARKQPVSITQGTTNPEMTTTEELGHGKAIGKPDFHKFNSISIPHNFEVLGPQPGSLREFSLTGISLFTNSIDYSQKTSE